MYHLVINGFGKQPESFNLIQFKKKKSIYSFYFFFLYGKYHEIFYNKSWLKIAQLHQLSCRINHLHQDMIFVICGLWK